MALTFNSLLNENSGYGTGWCVPVTRYHRHTRRLSISGGGTYLANLGATAFVLADKKVRDIKLSRAKDSLVIEHKSGIVEVLTNPGLGWDEWLLSTVYSPEGRAIYLDYRVARGRRYLSSVRDESRELLTVQADAATGNVSSVTLWPDAKEKSLTFSLLVQNDELRKISVPLDNGAAASWSLAYRRVSGLPLISELTLPTGAVERITYTDAALKLPNGAPLRALPAVASFTVIPGLGQPPMTRTYAYSSNNYLGFGSSVPWSNDGDNLYRAKGNYTYSCSETLTEGGARGRVLRHIQRVYNRFHLQVGETVSKAGKVVRQQVEYHEKPGVRFEDQPACFQRPKCSRTTYHDSSQPTLVREEVTYTDFDDDGNLLEKISPSGIVERFEYYPAEGAKGCPRDDFGARRWLKQKTILPAPDAAAAPELTCQFEYTAIPSACTHRPPFFVVASEALSEGKDGRKPVRTVHRSYENDTGSPFFGRMTRKTETFGNAATVFDFSYREVDGAIQTRSTLKGDVQASKTLWQDSLTGRELKVEGVMGEEVQTQHDRLGRAIKESVAPGRSAEAGKTFAYELPREKGSPSTTSTTDANGARVMTYLDGLGREVKRELQDIDHPDKPMRLVYNAVYDRSGQLVEEVETDWLDGEPYPQVTRHEYDAWGRRVASVGADGVRSHEVFDPVSLVHTQWVDGAGKTVSRRNVFGKDDSVERFDHAGKSLGITHYRYDGLGRCVQKTDPLNRTTGFSYDFADRLVSTVLPDGTEIRKEYSTANTGDYPTHVWVNDYLAGRRSYDALMRITEVTVGGRTETFTYKGTQRRPATHTSASGTTISYRYDDELNGQIVQRSVVGDAALGATFSYDVVSAKLLHASSPISQHACLYTPAGHLTSETITEKGTRYQARQRTSLKGLPLSYIDASGLEKHTRYDAFRRVSEVRQGAVIATFTYNPLGQVSGVSTLNTANGKSLVTRLEYDDFGREVRRALTMDNQATEVLSQAFDAVDKLVRRTLKRGEALLRDEHFSYDLRGRLDAYRCEGTHPPVDAAGKKVLSQRYQFDALDNITQLATSFIGGENTATYRYENADRTQLSRLDHSHPDYAHHAASFAYDADGRMLNDERGREYVYDALGRVKTIKGIKP
jgi:YD repeat-containing protein